MRTQAINNVLIILMLSLAGITAASAEVTTRGGLEAEAQGFSFELHGRIMVDTALFDDDITPLDSGLEFRRARLELAGTLYGDWGYTARYDFAGNEVTAKELYISYHGLDNAMIFMGQFKQFFGLAELTSSKYITFMEVALPMAFAPSYRIGVGYLWEGDNTTFGASAYGNEAGEGTENDGLVNFSSRFTYAPINNNNNVLHLGIAVAQESVNDTNSITFAERPESHIAPKLISATINNVDGVRKLGLEAAWVSGPFSLQSEYITTTVQRNAGFDDATLAGYYVQASWFLTGESRPYDAGSFGRVKPNGEGGAWQLAVRLSHLDFVDDSITGGEMNDITFGVNYYVNPHVRFMANYIQVEADYGAVVDEPSILQFRAQIDF